VAELLHDRLDLFLALDLDFVLLCGLIKALREDFEYWGASFTSEVEESNFISWWSGKFL